MKAYYDVKPLKFEAVGNGSVLYRYNIEEVEEQTREGEEKRIQWMCDEVVVWEMISKKKVVEVVISERWSKNHEQKLVNEYNSVVLGVIEGEEAEAVVEAYKSFLSERKTLKKNVEDDCDEAGIK